MILQSFPCGGVGFGEVGLNYFGFFLYVICGRLFQNLGIGLTFSPLGWERRYYYFGLLIYEKESLHLLFLLVLPGGYCCIWKPSFFVFVFFLIQNQSSDRRYSLPFKVFWILVGSEGVSRPSLEPERPILLLCKLEGSRVRYTGCAYLHPPVTRSNFIFNVTWGTFGIQIWQTWSDLQIFNSSTSCLCIWCGWIENIQKQFVPLYLPHPMLLMFFLVLLMPYQYPIDIS